MATTFDNIISQFHAHGLPPLDDHALVADGRIHRYGKGKKAWYVIHATVSAKGNTYYRGVFGYKGMEAVKIEYDGPQVSEDDAREMRIEQAAMAARAAQKRERGATNAAASAAAAWAARGERTTANAYLRRKGLENFAWHQNAAGELLVPMMRSGAVVGLQRIMPDGEKRFGTGTAKTGAYCAVRSPRRVDANTPPPPPDVVLISEGFATAATIALVPHLPENALILAAFDAGNLLSVAMGVRLKWAMVPIGIMADDDYLTPGNPGETYAKKVCMEVVNCAYVRPMFQRRPQGEKWTDFNDLLVAEGMPSVARQVRFFVDGVLRAGGKIARPVVAHEWRRAA